MRILISGASGFLGSALTDRLKSAGHDVCRLVRHNEKSAREIYWDPYHHNLNPASLEGFDAIIHLSGENVASSLWTSAKKLRIYNSRVKTTRFLVKRLAEVSDKPKIFITASGIGYYPDKGSDWLEELSEAGFGFFPSLCSKWEQETAVARKLGIPTVSLRTGMVLSKAGGALKAMSRPTKWGLGATLGPGNQYMSWIHLQDYLRLMDFCLEKKPEGALNATAPMPVTMETFTRKLASALHRPVFLKVPEWAIRLFMGEMGAELFLKSMRVRSARLPQLGFEFSYPDLDSALRAEYP